MRPWVERAAFLRATTNLSDTEIGKDEGVQRHRDVVTRTMKKPEAQELIRRYADEIRRAESKIVESLSEKRRRVIEKALDVVEEILNSPKASYAVKATTAQSVLKGYGEYTEKKELDIEGNITIGLEDPVEDHA